MRQLIIVRKDLGMSTGKIAAQCCHASLAYFSAQMMCDLHKGLKSGYMYHPCYEFTKAYGQRTVSYKSPKMQEYLLRAISEGKDVFYTKVINKRRNPLDGNNLEWVDEPEYEYRGRIAFPVDVYEDWLNDIWTKTVCEAKNKGHLLKAVLMAEELGLKENQDFFLIRDRCLTELEPEEVDENGVGRTLTCIGFRPLDDETAHKISKKFQLLK